MPNKAAVRAPPRDGGEFETSPMLRLRNLPPAGARIRNATNEPFPKNVEYGDLQDLRFGEAEELHR